MNPPSAVYAAQLEGASKKATLPPVRLLALGLLAGMFIALGAATSSTAACTVGNAGLARLVTGAVFPVGLLLIVFVGGELFTGNNLMAMGLWEGRFGWRPLLRNLALVWLANLAGSLLIAGVEVGSGMLHLGGGALAAHTVKVAASKAALGPSQCVCSGILCNLLVCAALLAGGAAKDAAGKFLPVYLPILAFVVGGFEHCVANMFYLPAGWLAAQVPAFAEAAAARGIDPAALTLAGIGRNLLFATVGNLLGGILFLAAPYALVRRGEAAR